MRMSQLTPFFKRVGRKITRADMIRTIEKVKPRFPVHSVKTQTTGAKSPTAVRVLSEVNKGKGFHFILLII